MTRILIIRFSSIGDIVLTSPVVRCISQQVKDAEIHFLTKSGYAPLLEANPHIHKVHTLQHSWKETVRTIRNISPDAVVDLHNNLRSRRLRMALSARSSAFPKLNLRKWALVNLKWNTMPDIHIVQRYLKAASFLGVQDDGRGLEHYIAEGTADLTAPLPDMNGQPFAAIAIGAQHHTKKLPEDQLLSLVSHMRSSGIRVALIGGPEDAAMADAICEEYPQTMSFCGKASLQESALLIERSSLVIAHDTGMMHIAAALQKPVISVWGNTVPELGMYPYYGTSSNNLESQRKQGLIREIPKLSCRPCSKLGYDTCPKGHFKCMTEQDMPAISHLTFELMQGESSGNA